MIQIRLLSHTVTEQNDLTANKNRSEGFFTLLKKIGSVLHFKNEYLSKSDNPEVFHNRFLQIFKIGEVYFWWRREMGLSFVEGGSLHRLRQTRKNVIYVCHFCSLNALWMHSESKTGFVALVIPKRSILCVQIMFKGRHFNKPRHNCRKTSTRLFWSSRFCKYI